MKVIISFFCMILFCTVILGETVQLPAAAGNKEFPFQNMGEVLQGTTALTWNLSPADMATKMLNGAHQFINKKIDESVIDRPTLWHRNFSSKEAYEKIL